MISSSDILRKLREDGWVEVHTNGSHVQLKHPSKSGKVTVKHPAKDCPLGTLKSIERQSGVRLR